MSSLIIGVSTVVLVASLGRVFWLSQRMGIGWLGLLGFFWGLPRLVGEYVSGDWTIVSPLAVILGLALAALGATGPQRPLQRHDWISTAALGPDFTLLPKS